MKGSTHCGTLGEQVGHGDLTIVNAPVQEGELRARAFDDEGHHTQSTTIIKNGTLESFLHNTMTSRYFDVPNTGNASRGGSGLTVAAQHIIVQPGPSQGPKVTDGRYPEVISVDGMHSGANAFRGLPVGASGYLCEDGRRIRSLRYHRRPQLLRNAGSDSRYRPGPRWNSQRSLCPDIRFMECSIAGE